MKPRDRKSLSAAHLAAALATINSVNRKRAEIPKCSAKAKWSGERCRRFAMANGKCDLHGGRTPKGDSWHKTTWPDGEASNFESKLARKAAGQKRAAQLRVERLAKMTTEEREKHDAWQRSHEAGSSAARKRARETRKQNAAARALFDRPEQAPDAEGQALADRIAELRKLAAALEAQRLTGGIFD